MKKILSICLIGVGALVGLNSCVQTDVEMLFDASAAERLNEVSDKYTQHLLTSSNGWALEYFPHTETDEDEPLFGVGYLMLTQFNKDMSVKVGMNNRFSGSKYLEDTSAWEILTDNGPVLSFNSFNNCIHAFSNPEDVSGTSSDETGKGMEGDYEFVMVDVPADGNYVMLKGKKRGAYSRLTKIDEPTDFAEYLSDVDAVKNKLFPTTAPNYDVITVAGKKYNMILNPLRGELGLAKIWPSESDSIFTKELKPFLITRHGKKEEGYSYNLRFRNKIHGEEDAFEQEFVYTEDTKKFVGVTDASNTIEGASPTIFFGHALRDLHTWNVHKTSVSDQYSTALTTLTEQAAALKYTYKSAAFTSWKEDVVNLNMVFTTTRKVNGKNQTVTATAGFSFDAKDTEDGVVLTYKGAADDNAQNVLNAISAISDFLNTLSGTYVCQDSGNPFVLDKIRVAKKDTPDFWFDVTYQR